VQRAIPFALPIIVFTTTLPSLAQQPSDERTSESCAASTDKLIFPDFETHRAEWAANYEKRRTEFRAQVMENESLFSKCAVTALRRDLTKNSRTSFGVQVVQGGKVARVAMLRANHSDNLYGACIARILCSFQLTPLEHKPQEILLFNFNLNRKARPGERPWEVESHFRPQ
jgi:hypothetical protein